MKNPELLVMIFLSMSILIHILVIRVNSVKFVTSQQQVHTYVKPSRIFSGSTCVIDYPSGNEGELLKYLNTSTPNIKLAMIMYYAPWCAMSMDVKWEYESAAISMKNEVTFTAINCWNSEGSCYTNHQHDMLSYPHIQIYVHDNPALIKYHGIMKSSYLISFLHSVIDPVKIISKLSDLQMFLYSTDTTVIGYFDFNKSKEPPGFRQFKMAAIKMMAEDSLNVVGFGAVTNRNLYHLTAPYNTKKSQLILNRVFNYTVVYNYNWKWEKHSNITKWIKLHRQHVTPWLQPPLTKSFNLKSHLNTGASVIMFTPRGMKTNAENMLRELALDYWNCNNSLKIRNIINRHCLQDDKYNYDNNMSPYRFTVNNNNNNNDRILYSGEIVEDCLSYPISLTDLGVIFPFYNKGSSASYIYEDKIALTPYLCSVCCTHRSLDTCRESMLEFEYIYPQCLKLAREFQQQLWKNIMSSSHICMNEPLYYNIHVQYQICIHINDATDDSSSHTEQCNGGSTSDRRVTDRPCYTQTGANLSFNCGEHCPVGCHTSSSTSVTLNHNLSIDDDTESSSSSHPHLTPTLNYSVTGLGCLTNRTLQFYLMDSMTYWSYAHHLRLTSHKYSTKNKQILVITDPDAEEQYALPVKDFNRDGIRKLVLDYTYENATRFLRSASHLTAKKSMKPRVQTEPYQGVTEIVGSNFQSIVLNNDNDVLLVYYTTWCAVCQSQAHVLLSLSQILSEHRNLIIARIDGEENDLPWQYEVMTYPTIILFPANRKSDSVVFPTNLKMSLTNLVKFVYLYSSTAGNCPV